MQATSRLKRGERQHCLVVWVWISCCSSGLVVADLSYPSGVLGLQGAHIHMGICWKIWHDVWNGGEMGFPGRQRDLQDLLFLRGGVGREGCNEKIGLQLPGCACEFFLQ